MADVVVLHGDQQLVVKDACNIPPTVLNVLQDGARIGDCGELALIRRILYGTCLEYGLEPADETSYFQTPSLLDTNEFKFRIPDAMYLREECTKSASLTFLCVVKRRYVCIETSAEIYELGKDAYSVEAASSKVYIPFYIRKPEEDIVLSNLGILLKNFRSKLCAPSLSTAAHETGRSLRLALLSIPPEILSNILRRLNMVEVLSLGRTCHEMQRITSADSIWEGLYRHRFKSDLPQVFHEEETLKVCFMDRWICRYKSRNYPLPKVVDRRRKRCARNRRVNEWLDRDVLLASESVVLEAEDALTLKSGVGWSNLRVNSGLGLDQINVQHKITGSKR